MFSNPLSTSWSSLVKGRNRRCGKKTLKIRQPFFLNRWNGKRYSHPPPPPLPVPPPLNILKAVNDDDDDPINYEELEWKRGWIHKGVKLKTWRKGNHHLFLFCIRSKCSSDTTRMRSSFNCSPPAPAPPHTATPVSPPTSPCIRFI